jgi:hypothetical protein
MMNMYVHIIVVSVAFPVQTDQQCCLVFPSNSDTQTEVQVICT